MRIVVFLSLCFSLSLQAESRSQTFQDELALSGGVFFAVGASNTAGFGLNVSLRDRILAHLNTQNPAVLKALQEQGKCLGVMVDRFFPTAFAELADPTFDASKLEEEVEKIIKEALATKCTVVVVDLFNPASLTKEQNAVVEKSEALSKLKGVLQSVDREGKRIGKINAKLGTLAKREPTLKIRSFNENLSVLTEEKQLDGLRLHDLFQDEGKDIHVSYAGQGHLFNIFVRKELETFTNEKVTPMAYTQDFSEKWENEILESASSLSSSPRGNAVILNTKELAGDTHFVKGTSEKGVMTLPGDLELIDGVIRKAVGKENAAFPISKTRVGTQLVYELNLERLAYSRIKLFPTASNPKVFVGMGTDYWGASLGARRILNKAFTNFVFVLTEIDEQRVDIQWKVLPPVKVGDEVQKISATERPATIENATWARELTENAEEYNRLEFTLEIRVDWASQMGSEKQK